MAHIRRNIEAPRSHPGLAAKALEYIATLYMLEENLRSRGTFEEETRAQRRAKALPVMDAMEAWMESVQHKCTPDDPLGKALEYAYKPWPRVRRYADDGRYQLDNNPVERGQRPTVMGRKNYLFSKTNEGQWTMRSYIHSWEAAKSPMSIRSNGWNTHLTTYTPASQRTNSQSYCLVTSFETRRVSDGYLRWIQSNHPKRGRAKMAHPLFAIAYNAFLLFIRLWIHWLRPRLQEQSLQKRVLPWLLLRRPREQLLPP